MYYMYSMPSKKQTIETIYFRPDGFGSLRIIYNIYKNIYPGSQVPCPPPMVWYPRPGRQQAAKCRRTKEKQGRTKKNKEKQLEAMCPRAHARMHGRAH